MNPKLPTKALKLISEYSKPCTRPDWKKGAPHSKILEQSHHFVHLSDMLINIKDYYNHDYNKLFDTLFLYTLLKLPFNKLLEKYGDAVFDLFYSYKPNQMNFYRWCRLVGHLHFVKKLKYDIPTKMDFK
jgi:hypothetical protein